MDKIGKATGPGGVDELVSNEPAGLVFVVNLFNYNIDGNLLKPEHKHHLDSKLIPFLRSSNHHVKIRSYTSKSGDAKYNEELSKERLIRVRNYLLSHGLPLSKVPAGHGDNLQAYGETRSFGFTDENPYERRVELLVYTGIKPGRDYWGETTVGPITVVSIPPDKPDEPQPKAPPAKQKNWQIRQTRGLTLSGGVSAWGVGVGAGTTEYHFELVDNEAWTISRCTFFGPQVNAGSSVIPGIFSGSLTDPSRTWNRFSTGDGVGVSDLEGGATWHEPIPGVAPTLTLNKPGLTVKVETGTTIGEPSSMLATGYFECRTPRPMRR